MAGASGKYQICGQWKFKISGKRIMTTLIGLSISPPQRDCRGIRKGFHVGFKLFFTTWGQNEWKIWIIFSTFFLQSTRCQNVVLQVTLIAFIIKKGKMEKITNTTRLLSCWETDSKQICAWADFESIQSSQAGFTLCLVLLLACIVVEAVHC